MRAAAKELEFERAAALRDEIQQVRLRVLQEDQSVVVGRALEIAAKARPESQNERFAAMTNRAPVFEVASVTVLPAGEEPYAAGEEPGNGEGDADAEGAGTASDWLPGIRDEHDDEASPRGRWQDRPTWDRSVTPNIRKRTGARAPRRR